MYLLIITISQLISFICYGGHVNGLGQYGHCNGKNSEDSNYNIMAMCPKAKEISRSPLDAAKVASQSVSPSTRNRWKGGGGNCQYPTIEQVLRSMMVSDALRLNLKNLLRKAKRAACRSNQMVLKKTQFQNYV